MLWRVECKHHQNIRCSINGGGPLSSKLSDKIMLDNKVRKYFEFLYSKYQNVKSINNIDIDKDIEKSIEPFIRTKILKIVWL